MNTQIDVQKSIKFLLQKQYLSEFVVINGCKQHTTGFNFEKWLESNKLVLEKEIIDCEHEFISNSFDQFGFVIDEVCTKCNEKR